MATDLNQPLSRNRVSPDRAFAVIDEQEADGAGRFAEVTTILLTASECPIGCNMCDLWQNTLLTNTPPGAIPRQIDAALENRRAKSDHAQWIKLYNSGNFFDAGSIPESDYSAIAERCQRFSRVVVENHPRFGGKRLQTFRDLIDAQLEIAVGLETVQPRWLARLGKRMSRDDFDRYARWLRDQGVDLRVFLIVGVPGISALEAIRWARLAARHACRAGARHISLIPARVGHGWGGLATKLPELSVQHLADLQRHVLKDVDGAAVVTIDVWNLETDPQTLSEIKHVNLSQRST